MHALEERLTRIEKAILHAHFLAREAAIGIVPEADETNDTFALELYRRSVRHIESLERRRAQCRTHYERIYGQPYSPRPAYAQ